MGWGIVLSTIFIIVAVGLLILYWFVPLSTTEFTSINAPDSVGIGNLSAEALQFYPNMRFPKQAISYKIYDCPLQKRDDMVRAFNTIEQETLINFYPVQSGEEISVNCEDTQRIEEGLFIAGEGGPTNITKSGDFNVIFGGSILLLRESQCPNPNVGIHELLHVLGFDHVDEEGNIMYPVSKCDQQISQGTIDLIDELYAIPSYPDIGFENVSAVMHGKYLDASFSIRNKGLERAPSTNVKIYADDKLVKEVSVDFLEIGHGRIISLTNIWVSKLSTDSVSFEIDSVFAELSKDNNIVELSVRDD